MPFTGTPLFTIEGLSAAEEQHTRVTARTISRTRERSRYGLHRFARPVANIPTIAGSFGTHRTNKPVRDVARSLLYFYATCKKNAIRFA